MAELESNGILEKHSTFSKNDLTSQLLLKILESFFLRVMRFAINFSSACPNDLKLRNVVQNMLPAVRNSKHDIIKKLGMGL